MKHAVIVQPWAAGEIEAAFLYIAEHASLEIAEAWFNRLDERLQTLAPRRCPVAPEDIHFEEELRHLLVSPYRVLFAIKGKRVHILHVRHMARRAIGEANDSPE